MIRKPVPGPPIPPEAGGDSAPRNPDWWRAYCACITEVDALIGKVVNALKARGLDENTILFYTSDHGDYAGDLGQWSKGDFHEPSVHVPFIASGPGIKADLKEGIWDFHTRGQSLNVLDEEAGKPRALAFEIPQHVLGNERSRQFLTSIDQVETDTGLDFFAELPDALEDRLEAARASQLWGDSEADAGAMKVYITATGKRYHYQHCRYAAKAFCRRQ